MQEYEVFCGRKTMRLVLPDRWDIFDVPMFAGDPLKNPEEKIIELLRSPTNSRPLADIVRPGDQVALCVTDTSRPCPDFVIIPPILAELEKAGISKKNVTILIGVGAHRAVSFEEMRDKFGYHIVQNYRIVNHDARAETNLANLGKTPNGAPRVVNSLLTHVNHIITVGVVDLHQYAGFSGGPKTLAVGCAGEETIKYTHSTLFLEKSGTIPGKTKGNLFLNTLWKMVEPLPFDFTVNVILNEEGQILSVDAGEPKAVHSNLINEATKKFIVEVDHCFDAAYMGVPHPKDINLYQATRAATYQALSEKPALKRNSAINLICSAPEGFGKGIGEMRFRDRMTKLSNPPAILLSMTGKQTLPGEQRAFMVARTMLTNPINVVGTAIPPEELQKACFVSQPLIIPGTEKEKRNVLVMKDGMKKVLKLK